ALAWSIAIAAAVVIAPSESTIGAAAIVLAIPCLALVIAIRPAVIALALMAALLGVGRAELPATDPSAATNAYALAGQTATVSGRIADDSRSAAGGSEVLVEPDLIVIGGKPVFDVGNLVVRWRGPDEAGFGDQLNATGRLVLPRDLPSFDRPPDLPQRHPSPRSAPPAINAPSPPSGLSALPAWLRARYIAALDAALPAP